ncbi:uncharacterized protein LOC132085670 isoform X1 [Ammospiza nelsoni]|uniref:uncharacterized protein LOC132085670 isoform X1 n=1 Tax=Ammospiza nelsoni TaxID=2857394 RepID=UPI00286A8907|nr:uncharacterized protein LOC132085670 isoform X1 [Ammospiza nelsoni]
MEPEELSPALLQPQVTVVAILGELLDTLSRENDTALMSSVNLYWDLEFFTRELRVTLCRTDATWWHQTIGPDGDDSLTFLSQSLAIYKKTEWITGFLFGLAALLWRRSVSGLVNSWDRLARTATKLRNTWRDGAILAADRAATATAWARARQDWAARYGTGQENMVELDQALGREEGAKVLAGHEAQVREQARMAASEATKATMERQWVEKALGLLERLVATCDEAALFPRKLHRLLWDTMTTLRGTSEASPKVPEYLVAKVAMAEQLWEASARLGKDHLLGAVDDIIEVSFGGDDLTIRSACAVAERCQRAIEDIPTLLQPLECPHRYPRMSKVSREPQKLSPALLQLPVTVVATLGELLAALPTRDEMLLLESLGCLYWDLEDFTKELQYTLYRTEDTWRHQDVTSGYEDTVTSLSQALAAYKSTPGTPKDDVTMAAIMWQESVSELLDRWARLAGKATELRNTCRGLATQAADRAATARAKHLQDEAARYGIAHEDIVELGQAQGGEEGAEVVARHGAQVRREARVAASEATRATKVSQRLEVALGLLERLVAACDKVTVFPRELQHLLWFTKDILEFANKAFPFVPKSLMIKVVMAEQLWEANARLAKDHLVGTLDNIIEFYFDGDPTSLSACGVAERCQKAIEDIPRLLRPLERPQGVPKVSPVSMEPQEVSFPQLQVLVEVVATLDEVVATQGEVVATVTGPHRGKFLHKSQDSLHEDLKNFTRSLRAILKHGGVTSLGHAVVPSLGRALATLRTAPGITWAEVRAAAEAWRELVARLVDSWDWLAREATKLREKVVTEQELLMALDRDEVAWALATYDGQVAAATKKAMGEAVAATRRGHWAVVTVGLLQHLVAMCDKATLFYWNMEWQLRDIEATLKGTNKVSPDVFQALVAKVAKFEWLWDASTRLAKDHLLGTLEHINSILLSPCGGCSDPGSRTVAERCQKAIEDIPRLLQGSFT